MSDLIKKDDSGILSLFHNQGDGVSLPKPFERDIFLFDTYVAGTMYVEGMDELEPHLAMDDRLEFFREPENPHDALAIVIKNADGVKIGYVPRADNAVFSRLMDAGKQLFARITSKKRQDNWLRIDIKVFLHE